MPRNEPTIEILIPNWNGRQLLQDCLDSLHRQTVDDFAVTVIDNGSTDGSVAFLAANYPQVRCIALPENRASARRQCRDRAGGGAMDPPAQQ